MHISIPHENAGSGAERPPSPRGLKFSFLGVRLLSIRSRHLKKADDAVVFGV